jgi:hypothetical protein
MAVGISPRSSSGIFANVTYNAYREGGNGESAFIKVDVATKQLAVAAVILSLNLNHE